MISYLGANSITAKTFQDQILKLHPAVLQVKSLIKSIDVYWSSPYSHEKHVIFSAHGKTVVVVN